MGRWDEGRWRVTVMRIRRSLYRDDQPTIKDLLDPTKLPYVFRVKVHPTFIQNPKICVKLKCFYVLNYCRRYWSFKWNFLWKYHLTSRQIPTVTIEGYRCLMNNINISVPIIWTLQVISRAKFSSILEFWKSVFVFSPQKDDIWPNIHKYVIYKSVYYGIYQVNVAPPHS